VAEALALREAGIGQICMGEVRGRAPPGFDFGNSPFEVLNVDFTGKTIIQRTSSGTQGIVAAQQAQALFASALVTAPATARALRASGAEHISLVAMGESAATRTDEDELCALHLRNLLEGKKMWKWSHHRELRIAAAQALAKIDPRYGSQVLSDSGLEPAELAIAALDSAPACPWVRQRRYERIVLRKTFSATISSSWGKSSILVRELSLGGGMGTKEDNLRVGSEANILISVGVRQIRGQVLLRRARVNEVGFEIVNTDLESRYRLRRLLVESLQRAWDRRAQSCEIEGQGRR